MYVNFWGIHETPQRSVFEVSIKPRAFIILK